MLGNERDVKPGLKTAPLLDLRGAGAGKHLAPQGGNRSTHSVRQCVPLRPTSGFHQASCRPRDFVDILRRVRQLATIKVKDDIVQRIESQNGEHGSCRAVREQLDKRDDAQE